MNHHSGPNDSVPAITLEQRVGCLERENRQMRLLILMLCSLLAACCILGAASKTQSQAGAKVVRTERLEIVGKDAKPGALLAVVDGEPTLEFYGKQKKTRMTIGVADGEPGLALLRSNGKPAIGLDLSPREYGTVAEPAIVLYDSDGKPRAEMMLVAVDEDPGFNFYNKAENPKVQVSVLGDAGSIALYDAQGKVIGRTP